MVNLMRMILHVFLIQINTINALSILVKHIKNLEKNRESKILPKTTSKTYKFYDFHHLNLKVKIKSNTKNLTV